MPAAVGSYKLCSFFSLLCYSSNATFFFYYATVNVSIMLKIMLSFHRNNHKPTAQTKVLCDMTTHDVHT